jgi:serine/threonine-protein kinase RsbT
MSHADTTLVVVAVREMAQQVGMGEASAASLATAASELVGNVIKYARSGSVTLRPVRQRDMPGLEVIVDDQGPGIDDLEFAMRDHASTGGTLGLGLPGTRRLVDDFEITTEKDKGTRVRVIKWA